MASSIATRIRSLPSSDTRIHVGTTTIDRLLDYVEHTPPDPLRAFACVQQRIAMIENKLALSRKSKGDENV